MTCLLGLFTNNPPNHHESVHIFLSTELFSVLLGYEFVICPYILTVRPNLSSLCNSLKSSHNAFCHSSTESREDHHNVHYHSVKIFTSSYCKIEGLNKWKGSGKFRKSIQTVLKFLFLPY